MLKGTVYVVVRILVSGEGYSRQEEITDIGPVLNDEDEAAAVVRNHNACKLADVPYYYEYHECEFEA